MIITNREEVIDKAFGVFVRMNYEKASIITLAKACGVTKTGIVYYFPHKLDLFMAVADKYVLQMHEPENKFAAPADTLAEFIGQYVAGVAASMKRIVELIGDNSSPHDCSPNFYYFHFLSQVRMYYPGIRQKIEKIYRQDYDLWEKVIQKAKESGEIRSDTNVNVPLLDIPKMILKKYKGKLPDGKILPVISNQKLNAYLKEIADICGIKKNLTFHLARHTFATTTTLSKGVPIETVSKMLGHTNIETTQIYARITNSKIGSDMQGLDKKFVGIEKIYKEVAM